MDSPGLCQQPTTTVCGALVEEGSRYCPSHTDEMRQSGTDIVALTRRQVIYCQWRVDKFCNRRIKYPNKTKKCHQHKHL